MSTKNTSKHYILFYASDLKSYVFASKRADL